MAPTDSLPRIGLGTFRLKGRDAFDSVTSALKLGYCHIDTAQMYDNETEVGEAVRQSGVSRERSSLPPRCGGSISNMTS